MKKHEIEKQLSNYEFKPVGEISLIGDRLGFDLTHSAKDTGYVYAWVEIDGTSAAVVYIGKAGRTLQARCDQHTGGFRSSKTGQKHADRIRRGIAKSRQYLVYARKASKSVVLTEPNISMESVEELALIRKFAPAWNALS